MIKITQSVRASLRTILVNSRNYDASTMRVSKSGEVTALKDSDKTYASHDSRRYVVGYAADMVRQDGAIVEGY